MTMDQDILSASILIVDDQAANVGTAATSATAVETSPFLNRRGWSQGLASATPW